MNHAQPSHTEIAVEALLDALEDRPASVREGTDPLVLLYWWKQRNPDTKLFMRALEDLDREGLVTIGPAPERRLRLSAHGFAWLDARLPVDEEAPAGPTGLGDTDTAPDPTPRRAAPAPVAERIAAVVRIFATLDLPPGRGLDAATLLRIWQLDQRPGAELRETLDAMAAGGRLHITRGARTAFALVNQGLG